VVRSINDICSAPSIVIGLFIYEVMVRWSISRLGRPVALA
jgi:ABC-type phosphate transport system permease subunit